MGHFSKIPIDTLDALELDAGVLLYDFDPVGAVGSAQPFKDEDLICATTGGITINLKPTITDFFEDVDNVKSKMKEGMHLDGWDESNVSFESITFSNKNMQLALGAADLEEGQKVTKILPRMSLEQKDFRHIWWVGDKANGGFIAVEINNALSTDGFQVTTEKNAKGRLGMTIQAHSSLEAQDEAPIVVYNYDPEQDPTPAPTYTYTEVTPIGTENPSEEGWYELVGSDYVLTTDTDVDTTKTYYERV